MSGGPIDGVVIDESTGKPAAGAIVVYHWYGRWFRLLRGSGNICYHAETAVTDADGKFHIDKWSRSWSMDDLRISSSGMGFMIYKPGYWDETPKVPPTPNIKYILPFKGTKVEYFEKVLGSPSWGCADSDNAKNEYRLYKAMADEATALAETPEQWSKARILAEIAVDSLSEQH